uniref:EOG090X0BWU n=1 Tax=Daphnia dolichocephala TaxID=2282166 RepID=A0A4Y7M459_9CRUS|nr:EOG090X0BWU [Daphnia dolichocephala]
MSTAHFFKKYCQRHLAVHRDNKLHALNDYDKQKTPEIPKTLEEYINHLAKTGETLFPWPKIRAVLRHKLELVIANFKEVCPTENLPPCPNVEPFNFEIVRDKILQQFDSFTCAPFTIQRLCELLCAPRKHYKRTDKFMRGIEKNLLVVTTVDPEQRKRSESVSSSQTLVNGVVDISLGSSRPPVNFGAKNDSRPVSAASDAASASDADSGISDTEDEEKPAEKQPVLASVPGTDQDTSETRETTNGAADVTQETKPSSITDTTSPVPTESQDPTVAMTSEESPTVQVSEDVVVPAVALAETEKVETELTAPSEDEGAKSIDVESVGSEEKTVEMEAEELPTTHDTIAKEEGARIAAESPQKPQESDVTATEVRPPLPSVETLETPVSDKKRPLEKSVGGEEDDSEHSPDAKQPRIFSPDKVIEDSPVPEKINEVDNQVAEEEQIAVTTSQETAEKVAETDPLVPTAESQ